MASDLRPFHSQARSDDASGRPPPTDPAWRRPCAAPFILIVALALAGLTACRNVSPPDLAETVLRPRAAPPVPAQEDLSPATRFRIADWYVTRFADSADAPDLFQMRQMRRQALQQAFRNWRGRLLEDYSKVLSPEGEIRLHLDAARIAALGKPGVIESHLQALMEELSHGLALEAKDEEIRRLFNEPPFGQYRQDLETWLEAQADHIDFPPQMAVPDLTQTVENAIAAARTKQRMLDALARARELENAGKISPALDTLEQALRLAPAEAALRPIGDYETVERLRQRLYRLPRQVITSTLRAVDANELAQARACVAKLGGPDEAPEDCADKVSAAENRLSASLRQWRQDPRLQQALEDIRTPVIELARLIARARGQVWARQIAGFAKSGELVQAVQSAADNISDIQQYASDRFLAYEYADAHPLPQDPLPVSCAALASDPMRAELARMAPQALQQLLTLADREVDVSLHHGSAVAICVAAMQLFDLIDSAQITPDLAVLRARTVDRLSRSSTFIATNVAGRKLTVEPFTSVVQGLGLTFTRDIENLLKDTLDKNGSSRFITLAPPESEVQARDYRVINAHIAAFSAEEPTETETIRKVSRWGPIQAMAGKEETDQAFSQELIEYAVHVKRIERTAHVRFSCDVLHEDQRTPIRINRFFRRTFVQESLHPFNDVRVVRTETGPTPDALHPPQPRPELVTERVWTPAELLDWVRRQAQLLAVSDIITITETYPLKRAKEGTEAQDTGRAADACNAWGLCFEYLRHLDLTTPSLRAVLETDAVDEVLSAALAKRQQRKAELLDLRDHAGQALRKTLSAMLREQREQRDSRPTP